MLPRLGLGHPAEDPRCRALRLTDLRSVLELPDLGSRRSQDLAAAAKCALAGPVVAYRLPGSLESPSLNLLASGSNVASLNRCRTQLTQSCSVIRSKERRQRRVWVPGQVSRQPALVPRPLESRRRRRFACEFPGTAARFVRSAVKLINPFCR